MAVLRPPDSLAHRLLACPCKALGDWLNSGEDHKPDGHDLAHPKYLVETDWLEANLDDAGVLSGGGIAASAVCFTMALLGRDNIALYDNSLPECGRDPALPMETGRTSTRRSGAIRHRAALALSVHLFL